MNNEKMFLELGISKKVLEFSEEILSDLSERFKEIDSVAESNQMKVIFAVPKICPMLKLSAPATSSCTKTASPYTWKTLTLRAA